MTDPTYNKDEIKANPVWSVAWALAQIIDDSAPIGWSKHIGTAECLLAAFSVTPKDGSAPAPVSMASEPFGDPHPCDVTAAPAPTPIHSNSDSNSTPMAAPAPDADTVDSIMALADETNLTQRLLALSDLCTWANAGWDLTPSACAKIRAIAAESADKIVALRAAVERLGFSLRFYKSRCELLEKWQSKMRDPKGKRYGAAPAPATDEIMALAGKIADAAAEYQRTGQGAGPLSTLLAEHRAAVEQLVQERDHANQAWDAAIAHANHTTGELERADRVNSELRAQLDAANRQFKSENSRMRREAESLRETNRKLVAQVQEDCSELVRLRANNASLRESIVSIVRDGIINGPCPTPAQWEQIKAAAQSSLDATQEVR